MKFLFAMGVTIGMAILLGGGMLMAVKGSPWLLIVDLLAGAGLFVRYGCATH